MVRSYLIFLACFAFLGWALFPAGAVGLGAALGLAVLAAVAYARRQEQRQAVQGKIREKA